MYILRVNDFLEIINSADSVKSSLVKFAYRRDFEPLSEKKHVSDLQQSSTLRFVNYYFGGLTPILLLWIGAVMIFVIWDENSIYFVSEPTAQVRSGYDLTLIISVLIGVIVVSGLLVFMIVKLKAFATRLLYGGVIWVSGTLLIIDLLGLLLRKWRIGSVKGQFATLVGIMGITALFIACYSYVKGSTSLWVRNAIIILASISLGRLVSLLFQTESVLFLGIVLAIFDYWSVFHGPLRRILGKPKKLLQQTKRTYSKSEFDLLIQKMNKKGFPVVLIGRGAVIGIGDLVFFALYIFEAITQWGMVVSLFTLLLISAGHLITLRILNHISPLPGLPVPVILVSIYFAFLVFL